MAENSRWGRSLFGLEAELAISATTGGRSHCVEEVVNALAKFAARTLVHLKGDGSRMYLANGALLYIDVGNHPEVATPECTTPSEAVSHLLAAERMVARLAGIARAQLGADELLVGRVNVDYLARTTWGCHESYLGRQSIERYQHWLIPHLVSRIAYTGSGGLDPLSPGIRLSLSPRVAMIDRVVSGESTSSRGIFHTRDEALSRGYSRVHVLAGDNACSQLATWLKVGTTALIVAIADAGASSRGYVELADPLVAIRQFARDPHARVAVAHADQRTTLMSAFDVQRHLLARVEACCDSGALPDWAAEVCRGWRSALDQLEAPSYLQRHAFDWPLKFELFLREIRRVGHTEETIAIWSDALERIALSAPVASHRPSFLDHAAIDRLRTGSPTAGPAIDEAVRMLEARNCSWTGLDDFNALRGRLCSIDVRFGELGAGIFETLDRQGALRDHRVVADADVAWAADNAPAGSRAAARAHWVRKLARYGRRYTCNWQAIVGDNRELDLGDPFATEVQWRSVDAA